MCELAIVIPTLNERRNIEVLVSRLKAALPFVDWEVIFVDDDSPDRTWAVAWQIGASRRNVRCLRRVGRRGLSSACVEGMLSSGAKYLAVMDADLQHDERLLPQMLETIRNGCYDIVVASRFVGLSTSVEGLSPARERMSRIGNWISRRVCRADLSDPLSGFFMLRRELLNEIVYNLSSMGFKILIDIFASSPRPLAFAELPFTFRQRQYGESKLDAFVISDFLKLLLDKTFGWLLPAQFIEFVLVGAFGVALHLVLLALLRQFGAAFQSAQIAATAVAIFANYNLNNLFTFRHRRLTGNRYWRGLLSFALVCACGAYANVKSSTLLFNSGVRWWIAGGIGAFVGGLWNYSVSNFYVWRNVQRQTEPAVTEEVEALAS